MAEPRWTDAFLTAVADGFSVKGAAETANISRSVVYDRLKSDEAFKSTFDQALDAGTEKLEDEARRRAVEGVEQPVFHAGDQVGTVLRYSDTLLIFLLKARKPERYREHHKVEHSGSLRLDLSALTDDELAALKAMLEKAKPR